MIWCHQTVSTPYAAPSHPSLLFSHPLRNFMTDSEHCVQRGIWLGGIVLHVHLDLHVPWDLGSIFCFSLLEYNWTWDHPRRFKYRKHYYRMCSKELETDVLEHRIKQLTKQKLLFLMTIKINLRNQVSICTIYSCLINPLSSMYRFCLTSRHMMMSCLEFWIYAKDH